MKFKFEFIKNNKLQITAVAESDEETGIEKGCLEGIIVRFLKDVNDHLSDTAIPLQAEGDK